MPCLVTHPVLPKGMLWRCLSNRVVTIRGEKQENGSSGVTCVIEERNVVPILLVATPLSRCILLKRRTTFPRAGNKPLQGTMAPSPFTFDTLRKKIRNR